MTLNLNGQFHGACAVLPVMIRPNYGKIVDVGGTFGIRGRDAAGFEKH